MSARHLFHITGVILVALGVALGSCTLLSALEGGPDFTALAISTVACTAVGLTCYSRTSLDRDLTIREGYAVVSLAWLTVGVFGSLPYLLSGAIRSPAAALFESVSGFSTTGATVFADVEALPRGILLWRALTQWLGGMGIIVLGVAILPFLGVGGLQLFRAEVPGPSSERLQPRIAQTAKLLWIVYAGLTAAQALLLVLCGMTVFEAIAHAFTTLSTGGFSTRNASVAAYDSALIQYVFIFFMYVAGVSFTLHYRALTGRPGRYFGDTEWRAFTGLIVGFTALCAAGLFAQGTGAGMEETVRAALFQVVSIGTTTGYVTVDYERWLTVAQLALLFLMLVGGMAGSTAGGMKVIRLVVFIRHGLSALKLALHPRAVVITRVSGVALGERDLLNILAFIFFFVAFFVAGVAAMAALGHDLETSIAASAASIGNVGPGLGRVGATDNYGWMGPASHLVLTFLMLVGRLEVFTVLLLFHRDLWRHRPV